MRNIFLITAFFIASLTLLPAQNPLPSVDSILTVKKTDKYEETPPSFPGGEEALLKFLSDNVTYPPKAKKKNITGKVYASFIIEKDGSVSHIKVIKDIGRGCGKEVVRVLNMMPKWNPGYQNNHPVRVRYTIPVGFWLD
jgi:periplasmic protein TonB